MAYLANLTLRLAAGAAALPQEMGPRHAAFLLGSQNQDGGFSGREGPSDLYYTGFAVRALGLLGELHEPVARRIAGFLSHRLDQPASSIDFLSAVFTAAVLGATLGADAFGGAPPDWAGLVSRTLGPLRLPDGSYARSRRSGHGSMYHTFLATASLELVGLAPPEPERTADWVRSCQCEDGGFAELARLRRSGTNPTAAAVGLLQLLNALDDATRTQAADWLCAMQTDEGGLRAHARIPAADLLSTFTALVALADLNALAGLDLAAVARYVRSLELPEGGFLGGSWDDQPDVEYTFYGLGALALVATGG